MKIKEIIKYVVDPNYRFLIDANRGKYDTLDDQIYIERKYKAKFGRKLDLNNPVTFNEKLQWLKLYDRNPAYTEMVDKYEVKKYVARKIGKEYLIPSFGVWDHFDEIDFGSLPNQFVLKCTHDSGGIYIVKDKDKFNYSEARKSIEERLKHSYYLSGREWPYKYVKPRIIAEKFMEDSETAELRDYKFFCFGGVAKCFKVDFDRFKNHQANYFTIDGELMKLGEEICPPDSSRTIKLPLSIKKMKELAETLSSNIPFLRCDFYDVNGNIYFGELTFFPASGLGKFIFDGNDEMLGSWIQLPDSIGGGYMRVYDRLIFIFKPVNGSGPKIHRDLIDYKIHCFNGIPKVILVCQDRFADSGMTEDFFDVEWNKLHVQRRRHKNASKPILRPRELDCMLKLAKVLSSNIPFVRVDFYTIQGKVYFGELTFFPAGGFEKFIPDSFDLQMGEWIDINSRS